MEAALSPDQVHAFPQLSNVEQHIFQRHCYTKLTRKRVLFTNQSTPLYNYLHNAVSDLTCCSFIHKVQFIVEVGQFGVLLFHNESYVVEQSHLPVCRLCVQQLFNNRNKQ